MTPRRRRAFTEMEDLPEDQKDADWKQDKEDRKRHRKYLFKFNRLLLPTTPAVRRLSLDFLSSEVKKPERMQQFDLPTNLKDKMIKCRKEQENVKVNKKDQNKFTEKTQPSTATRQPLVKELVKKPALET